MKKSLLILIGIILGLAIAYFIIKHKNASEDPQGFVPPTGGTSDDTLGEWIPPGQLQPLLNSYIGNMWCAKNSCTAISTITNGGYIGVQKIQNLINNNDGKSTIQYNFFMNSQSQLGVVFYAAHSSYANRVIVTGVNGFCPNLCQYPPPSQTSDLVLGEQKTAAQANTMMNDYSTAMQCAVTNCASFSLETQGGYIGVQNLNALINVNDNKSTIKYSFFMNSQNKIGVAFYAAAYPSQILVTGSKGFCPNLCQYPPSD